MCRKVICSTCKKPTWAGCGQHVEEALKDVPKAQRCQCQRVEQSSTTSSSKNPSAS